MGLKTDWEYFHQLYPVNQEMIWLNNCGTTSPSTEILQELDIYLKGFSRKGVLNDTHGFAEVQAGIKKTLSGLLGCQAEELALIHNTSEGMNLLSHSVVIQPGQKILLMQDEYPSNVYPWEHWSHRGAVLEFVGGDSPEEFLQELEKKLQGDVALVALSAVHWCTGMVLPLKEISDLCKKAGTVFILDGAQGVGHIDINLGEIHVDAMAFPAWKWLLGPLGLGVLYVRNSLVDKLDFTFKGQSSVTDSENYLPYKSTLRKGAGRFEYSTPAFTEWVYFQKSLSMLEGIGFEIVRLRILELAEYLKKGLRDSGYILFDDKFSFSSSASGIVVFEKPGESSAEIIARLRERKIQGALRKGRIRLSPHIYNSFQQLDVTLKALSV